MLSSKLRDRQEEYSGEQERTDKLNRKKGERKVSSCFDCRICFDHWIYLLTFNLEHHLEDERKGEKGREE